MKKFVGTADKTGRITIDMDGYQGESCVNDYQKILGMLERDFGITVKSKTEKRKATASAAVKQGVSA